MGVEIEVGAGRLETKQNIKSPDLQLSGGKINYSLKIYIIRGWSPSRGKCTRDMEFGTQTKLTKQTPGDNCHGCGWSPTIPRMVPQQLTDVHPTEGSKLQTRNLAVRLSSQN